MVRPKLQNCPAAGDYEGGPLPATAGQSQPVSWWTNFSNADQSPAFALVPAVSCSAGPVGYLVNAYDPGKDTASQLTIWTVDGTNLSAPVLGSQTLPVAAFSEPPNAEQIGTDIQINTWDAEITNVVLPQHNVLWVVQATGCTQLVTRHNARVRGIISTPWTAVSSNKGRSCVQARISTIPPWEQIQTMT